MSEQSTETKLALLEAELQTLRLAVMTLQEERNHALKWGVVTLGATVMSMGAWIVDLFTNGHIK